jgi:hypothetical protein
MVSSLKTGVMEYWSDGVLGEDLFLIQDSSTPTLHHSGFLGQSLSCGYAFTMLVLLCAQKKPQAFPPAARQNTKFTSVTAGRLLPQEAQEEAKARAVTNA